MTVMDHPSSSRQALTPSASLTRVSTVCIVEVMLNRSLASCSSPDEIIMPGVRGSSQSPGSGE